MSDLQNFGLEDLSVLIVEKDRWGSNLVETLLKAMGVTNIRVAFTEVDAVGIIKHDNPDIVIMEYLLNQGSTIDLVKRIRAAAFEPYQYSNIIMLTGRADMSTVAAARDSGVNEFLAKPFNAHTLYSRICSMIVAPRPFVDCKNYKGPERRRRNYRVENERRKG
ncbi:putative Chemotaxis protein CheYIII [Candidatus Terasakiella magnetica]|uniref:Putative Chemotaxis protein CheYIII n=1 Tax=Candidatus Terasakiella magnetica TaxID=1867952 RepID=A0A1C3RFW5_9PROT|nr:response regulator [Candidatus Terasakiella magnetica]SCA56170.1 putative Chemotaxis protein CheYIII [Candidatus Terasakiella magnetica]